MSPGLFQEFMVFVPGVTQGNEDAGSTQDSILLFRCKSGELGSREVQDFLVQCQWSEVSPQNFFVL